MRLRVLGCSGIHPTAVNPASGFLVESPDTRLWLDAGTGTFAALQAADEDLLEQLDAVILTHGHGDHCLDLIPVHYALRFGAPAPRCLPLYCPRDTWDRLCAFVAGSEPDQPAKLRRTFEPHFLEDGSEVEIGDLALRFQATQHSVPTVAVRLERGDVALAYTADTGPGADLTALARGADLLLAEATYQDAAPGPPVHLTATQAGELARRAEVRQLLLTHLTADLDPAVSKQEARGAAGEISVSVARPGRVVQVV